MASASTGQKNILNNGIKDIKLTDELARLQRNAERRLGTRLRLFRVNPRRCLNKGGLETVGKITRFDHLVRITSRVSQHKQRRNIK